MLRQALLCVKGIVEKLPVTTTMDALIAIAAMNATDENVKMNSTVMPSTPAASAISDRVDFCLFEAELKQHASTWTQSAVFAREHPQGIALYAEHGNRTFLELHQNANRLANALCAYGLVSGDAVALMCRNRAEFIEVFLACMRIGLRLTPVNTHLTWNEATYIVENCQAKIFFIEALLATALGQSAAFAAASGDETKTGSVLTVLIEDESHADMANTANANSYCSLLKRASHEMPASLAIGSLMLYTSGTTGKPKGVYRDLPEPIAPQYAGSHANYDPLIDTDLCCGPAYHSAPLLFDVRWPLASGVPLVMLDKWDTLGVLNAIETYAVTHTHMVATMFQRLLSLEPTVRAGKDVTSLRFLVHGAAPCPIHIKRAMIDWLGPVLVEYYGATEGGEGIHVGSAEWLTRPGTVGRMDPALGHIILDDNMQEIPAGSIGRIYFKAPDSGRFAYFGDAEKTAAAYAEDRFTLGDMGYVDADGYLFLTGRVAECIISGGVNIYPQEVDDVLMLHPSVRDVCTVGIPDDEWGEQVVSLVVLAEPQRASVEFATALMAYAATKLAGYKRPRHILFETELPRSASGKLLRQQVRQRFWVNQGKLI